MSILYDPKIFNYIICTLYATNCFQFALRGIYWHAAYWLCALGITAVVTWGNLR